MNQTIRVPLSSNAIYVSGTVNGVDCTWTLGEGNVWWTIADRSADGVYRVVLSIVYGDGKTASDSITLYYGLVLVTDRTADDVTNGTEKGSYNASDLNRVGSAMVYLRDKLNDNGYVVEIVPKTDWRDNDVPVDSDMILYLNCVSILRDSIALPAGTAQAPRSMINLTYSTANEIEKILEAIDAALVNSIAFVWQAGDIYSGEVI